MRYLLIFSLLLATGISNAQIYAYKKRSALLLQLQSARTDTGRLDILLNLSNAYIKGNLPDSSLFYSSTAIKLARDLHRPEEESQALFFACKANAIKGDMRTAKAIMESGSGKTKIDMAQELMEHYAFRPGNLPIDLDSAWPYMQRFLSISDSIHTTWAIQNARVVLAKYYFQRGQLQKGIDLFEANLREDQRDHDKAREAKGWSMFSGNLPEFPATVARIVHCDSQAVRLYAEAGDPESALYSLEDLAWDHWTQGKFDWAENEQRRANEGMLALGKRKLYPHYIKHAIYQLYLGNHARSLQLLSMARKNMDSLQEDYQAWEIDKQLGNVYWAENEMDKSLHYYQLAIQEMQGRRDRTIHSTALRLTKCLIGLGRLQEAKSFLQQFERSDPAIRNRDKEMMAAAWGSLDETMGRQADAERQYLQMVRFDSLSIIDQTKEIDQPYDIAQPEASYTMGRFYFDKGAFARAHPYLEKALQPASVMPVPIDLLRDDHLLLSRVDSALGNFPAALHHRLLFERYADSISRTEKERQFAELQIRYETEKKDQDIALLNKTQLLDKTELNRATLVRNIILIGLLAALLFIALLYRQYNVKQKSNRAINEKNETLAQLVKEKEWLLREVHHRVKNNLQMVVSLLDSQMAYLSADAQEAVRNSQGRVFSISLIHQKLYQDGNPGETDLSTYLPELVNYLRDVYGIKSQVAFHLDIVPLELDISQAVSIGLILNEALTNSIKHAFPAKNRTNAIVVEIAVSDSNIVHLKIADNGVGLPAGFDPERQQSLGVKLMSGLTDDLGGSFSMRSANGTTITIRFVANMPFESARKIIASNPST